jgi:hypothetical protein
MNIFSYLQPTTAGFHWKPAARLLFLALLIAFPLLVRAQAVQKSQADSKLMGVGIGTTLTDAHLLLDKLGTSGGRITRDGGQKVVWALDEGRFSSIALKTNKAGRVVWISGFARQGFDIPFEEFGDRTNASRFSPSQAIWNVETPDSGYRLVLKGTDGKVAVAYLLSLYVQPE